MICPATRGLRSYAAWLLLSVANATISFVAAVIFSQPHYQTCNAGSEATISIPLLCILSKAFQLAVVNPYIAHKEVQHKGIRGKRRLYVAEQ